jgi:hypothetical protein
MRGDRWFVVLLIAGAMALPLSVAQASHEPALLQLATPGPGGGGSPTSSVDGSRVWFISGDQLAPEDTDSNMDVYEWSSAGTLLVSTGPTDAPSFFDNPFVRGASDDGTHVFFTTGVALTGADTDTEYDIYERFSGTTTLVSTGPVGPEVTSSTFVANSDDGNRVFFETVAALTPDDQDSRGDVYEWSAGVTTLVSTGPTDPPGSRNAADIVDVSADGSRAFFVTRDSLVPEDTDTAHDLYERSGGTTTLISVGPTGGNGDFRVYPSFIADDGNAVFFQTNEPLVADDTDATRDVYVRSGGTTRIVTDGPDPDSNQPVAAFDGTSADGQTAYFRSFEQLTPDDTDGLTSLYVWKDGVTSVIPLQNASTTHVPEIHVSESGERLVLYSDLPELPSDTDGGGSDLYAWENGTLTLLTGGTANTPAIFVGGSPDLNRVFFSTAEALVVSDQDTSIDIYENHWGSLSDLTIGPAGGNGQEDLCPQGCAFRFSPSREGDIAYFVTDESLMAADTDPDLDIYRAIQPTGYPRPQGASPLRVPLVPAFAACTAPNREHGPPLAFGSCAPPAPGSPNLTVGIGDGDPALARSVGFVRFRVDPGTPGAPDDTDVRVRLSLSNVMRASDLSEYTGELRAAALVRLTDRDASVAQTTQDFPLEWDVPCVPTAAELDKSLCDLATTLDAIAPGAAAEGTRAVWVLDQVKVYDGGPDEDGATTGDNSLFATQGVFIP